MFEWDPAKAASTLRKHRVSFDIAVRAFADPLALTEQDRTEGSEQRWQTIGSVDRHYLLLVAHTIYEEDSNGQPIEVPRIISVRKADRKERQRYEHEIR
jgi:uncharacterized DUF497 family protein